MELNTILSTNAGIEHNYRIRQLDSALVALSTHFNDNKTLAILKNVLAAHNEIGFKQSSETILNRSAQVIDLLDSVTNELEKTRMLLKTNIEVATSLELLSAKSVTHSITPTR